MDPQISYNIAITGTFLSVIAIIVSVVSIILQYTIEGPKVDILNSAKAQHINTQRYDNLPETVQKLFPPTFAEWPGCAWVEIVFGNAGDRAGIATISNVEIKNDHGLFGVSYHSNIVVPAYEIVNSGFLLRNIPLAIKGPDMAIELVVTLEWGGYHSRSGKYVYKGRKEETFRLTISPPTGPDPAKLVDFV